MSGAGEQVTTSLPGEITAEIRNGLRLAGDDYTGEKLRVWFDQEREAFFQDNAGNCDTDRWYAHLRYINERLGFSRLPSRAQPYSLLVVGPGSGIEMESLASRNPHLHLGFLEASENFKEQLRNKYRNCQIVDARVSGEIGLASNTQDAVCAFCVLHHIPNVSYVVAEVSRVLKNGGLFLAREPCSSMGDWRFPRCATPNERGVSRNLLVSMARSAGLELVTRPVPVAFVPLNSIFRRMRLRRLIGGAFFYWLDRAVSCLVSVNDHYWRDTILKRMGPSSYFYVFRKP